MFHVEHSPDGSTCRPREGFEGAERSVPRGTFHPQVVLDVGPSRHPRCSTWNIGPSRDVPRGTLRPALRKPPYRDVPRGTFAGRIKPSTARGLRKWGAECSTWNISPAGRPGRWPLHASAMFHVEHRSIPRCSRGTLDAALRKPPYLDVPRGTFAGRINLSTA